MANGGGPNWNTALNSSLPCKGKEKRGGEKEGGEKEGREDGEERKKKSALELPLLLSCTHHSPASVCLSRNQANL